MSDAPWPPHFRKVEGEAPRVAPSRAKASSKPKRIRMPLIVVANSPDREAAMAGLERWKKRHLDVAKHLAVDDVLVDSMRGRSSTWTRIRINLRNVPEAERPPQETPDPDDDPTREWREANCRVSLEKLASFREDRRELLRRHDFQLIECAIRGLFVGTPPAELRRVPKTRSLHVVVCDFDHELRAKRFPGKILALAPSARSARPPLASAVDLRHGPIPPWMLCECRAVGREKLHQLATLGVREARTHADVLEPAFLVVEAEEQRSDCRFAAILVPAEAGDDAIAVALVLHLQHDPLPGFVDARNLLRHHAVEARPLETAKPILGRRAIRCRRRQVKWGLGVS